MKYIIYTLLFVVWFLWVAKVEIQFSPFKITLHSWLNAIAWVFAILAVVFFQISAYQQGNIEGYKEAIEDVLDEYKKAKS